jgi:hypothetical protein
LISLHQKTSDLQTRKTDMLADYSTFLITIGSLACATALGWFFESVQEAGLNDDSVSPAEDAAQRQRASIYMLAVVLTMGASVLSFVV